VVYEYGTEDLYNFSIAFIDSNRNSYTVNRTSLTPQYNNTAGKMFAPGMMQTWNINITSYSANTETLTGATLQSVRVNALCQLSYPISAECKSGQSCMV
jgi:hypothetical protein